MSHLTLEILLMMLLAYFVGCILGYLGRRIFAGEKESTEAETEVVEPQSPPPAAALTLEEVLVPQATVEAAENSSPPISKPAVQEAEVEAPLPRAGTTGKPERPMGIGAARRGRADNLQRISGIGPKLERTLHGLGFYHYDQLAGWTADQVLWVNEHLRFKGRIERDNWIAQARLLAEGREEEFMQLYGASTSTRRPINEKRSSARPRRSVQRGSS